MIERLWKEYKSLDYDPKKTYAFLVGVILETIRGTYNLYLRFIFERKRKRGKDWEELGNPENLFTLEELREIVDVLEREKDVFVQRYPELGRIYEAMEILKNKGFPEDRVEANYYLTLGMGLADKVVQGG